VEKPDEDVSKKLFNTWLNPYAYSARHVCVLVIIKIIGFTKKDWVWKENRLKKKDLHLYFKALTDLR